MDWISKLLGTESDEERWVRYCTSPNTDALLREKAIAFAPTLVGTANRHAERIRAILPEHEEIVLSVEFLFILLHLTDRHAFGQLGPARRDLFMDPLAEESFDVVASTIPDKATSKKIRSQIPALYWDRVQRYAQRNVFTEENEGDGRNLKNTIGFAFAEVMGQDHPATGLALMLEISRYELQLVETMKIREFIGR